MNKNVYLDNAAAMPVRPEILDAFKRYSLEYFSNPESVHNGGQNANKAIQDAAERIIMALTGDVDYSLSWTSSATEAINVAFGFFAFAGKTVLTTESEHPAMQHAIERAGFCEIRKISLGSNGLVDLKVLEEKLDNNVGVVAVHHVQNETGAIQNLVGIRSLIDKKAPKALFIVDTVQSVAKIAIPWSDAKINIGFIGGHKVGAPSGGALIYNLQNSNIKENLFLKYLNELRFVSHSVGRADPAICLTLADAIINAEIENCLCKTASLNRYFRAKIANITDQNNIEILFPVPDYSTSPYIATFLIPPYQGEIIVRMLSDKGVLISAGSACEASKEKASQALLAMGISSEKARTMLRVSFCFDSDKNDINKFIEAFDEVLKNY